MSSTTICCRYDSHREATQRNSQYYHLLFTSEGVLSRAQMLTLQKVRIDEK